jgi:hypothetical protein
MGDVPSDGEVDDTSEAYPPVSLPIRRETLMTVCQLAGISAAGLILPCSLIDLAFNTYFLSTLLQPMLVAVALALMVAVWTDQEE